MSSKFQPIDRHTLYLLPPSLQDWLPEDHLARFVLEIVDQLDLTELETAYSGGGKAAYHPSLLLALLFYGYATGVFSSRKLERATYDSVAFRFITADSHPDHDTIATFRKRFMKELEGLFGQILLLSHAMGFLKLGNVSLDGTKIKANASKHKALSWKMANRLEKQLQEEVRVLLARAEQADAQDDVALDIPEELSRRSDRLAAIAKAKTEIERRARVRYEAEKQTYDEKIKTRKEKEETSGKKPRGRTPKAPQSGPKDSDQVNFTDEESRIMPSSEGFVQAYNAQAGVDIDSHLIVSNHLSQHPNDKQELAPALACLEKIDQNLGKVNGLLADTGYHSEGNVKKCEAAEIVPYIPGNREHHNSSLETLLTVPPPCPEEADAMTLMKHRLKTKDGKALYGKRKSTVETVFGIIKEVMGFRRFSLRGLAATEGEWNLVCMAWNLKRMHVLSS